MSEGALPIGDADFPDKRTLAELLYDYGKRRGVTRHDDEFVRILGNLARQAAARLDLAEDHARLSDEMVDELRSLLDELRRERDAAVAVVEAAMQMRDAFDMDDVGGKYEAIEEADQALLNALATYDTQPKAEP